MDREITREEYEALFGDTVDPADRIKEATDRRTGKGVPTGPASRDVQAARAEAFLEAFTQIARHPKEPRQLALPGREFNPTLAALRANEPSPEELAAAALLAQEQQVARMAPVDQLPLPLVMSPPPVPAPGSIDPIAQLRMNLSSVTRSGNRFASPYKVSNPPTREVLANSASPRVELTGWEPSAGVSPGQLPLDFSAPPQAITPGVQQVAEVLPDPWFQSAPPAPDPTQVMPDPWGQPTRVPVVDEPSASSAPGMRLLPGTAAPEEVAQAAAATQEAVEQAKRSWPDFMESGKRLAGRWGLPALVALGGFTGLALLTGNGPRSAPAPREQQEPATPVA